MQADMAAPPGAAGDSDNATGVKADENPPLTAPIKANLDSAAEHKPLTDDQGESTQRKHLK